MGVGCELCIIHPLFETGDSGAVNADEVSGSLHRLTKSNGGLRDTGFGGGGMCPVIHIDRVFQLLAIQDFK